ncbi:ATP-binding cassette domain-containing protein [Microbacterium sp. Se63.02b]|uniref:ATP-binding cassette domain-containing protein n=1 Tax=Microbacterium sp. Se63.02b TaxID=2709304 RepID=UPI001FCE8E84|nr:ATP-binding cassette domain-containing protein [Microbacterium sp. Se63.02b]
MHAVKGVSLTVERGQIVGLVGESGCGKSSLARVAVGIDRPTSGAVRFEGESLHPLTMRRRPRRDRGLQMVFQNPYASLSPRRSIGAQLLDGAPTALDRAAGAAEVARLLRLVGLDESAASRYPAQFSGGQRQRLAIARARREAQRGGRRRARHRTRRLLLGADRRAAAGPRARPRHGDAVHLA